MTRLSLLFVLATGLSLTFGPASAQEVFVAGVTPSERPAGAPRVEGFGKDGTWYAQALEGVVAPYPESLKFLEDQEGWFSPFIRPGMTGPYDVRGWH